MFLTKFIFGDEENFSEETLIALHVILKKALVLIYLLIRLFTKYLYTFNVILCCHQENLTFSSYGGKCFTCHMVKVHLNSEI